MATETMETITEPAPSKSGGMRYGIPVRPAVVYPLRREVRPPGYALLTPQTGCACNGGGITLGGFDVSAAVARNPFLYLLGAFALGYFLKGR